MKTFREYMDIEYSEEMLDFFINQHWARFVKEAIKAAQENANEYEDHQDFTDFMITVIGEAEEEMYSIPSYKRGIAKLEKLNSNVENDINGKLYDMLMKDVHFIRGLIQAKPELIKLFPEADKKTQEVAIQSGGPTMILKIQNPDKSLVRKYRHISGLSDVGVV